MYNASACQPNKEHPIKGKRIIAQVFIIDDLRNALMPAHIIGSTVTERYGSEESPSSPVASFPYFPGLTTARTHTSRPLSRPIA